LPFYIILGIVPRLAVHRDAANDLACINACGEHADHGAILAFLQQGKSDPNLLETLAENWFGEDGSADYSVRKIVSMHQRGKRLWRVKVLTLKGLVAGYRVLYAFDPGLHVFYVLGVPPREIAYDEAHPRIQRLIAVYDSLGIS
jgi:mRNA-degrading endonuclease RelE of RelBE toxin-antitoxin system